MATAAAIEVIIRARDEASAVATASMQKIAADAQKLQGAMATVGRDVGAGGVAGLKALGDEVTALKARMDALGVGAAERLKGIGTAAEAAGATVRKIGAELDAAVTKAQQQPTPGGGTQFGARAQQATRAVIDLTAAVSAGQDVTASMVGSLASFAGMMAGPVAIGVTLAAAGVLKYMEHIDAAAKKQIEWNEAIKSFDPAFFVKKVQEANAELALMEQRAGSAFGRFRNAVRVMTAAGPGAQGERDTAAAEAAKRLQMAAEEGLRAAQTAREQALVQAAEARARTLEAVGDPAGAAQARAEAEKSYKRIIELQKESLDYQKRLAANKYPAGLQMPVAEVQTFDTRATTAREQADAAQAQRQAAYQQVLEAAAERIAQRQLQRSLQAIDAEKAIAAITAQAATRREVAEAERLGTVQQVTAAQIAGILRVRDVELKAIREAADARARAARGPTRESDVLDIRRREAQETARIALTAAEEVTQAQERGIRARQQREEEWRAIQRSLGQISTEEELRRQQAIVSGATAFSEVWLTAYRQVIGLQKELAAEMKADLDALAARLRETKQTTTRPSDVQFQQFDRDEQLRKAKLAQEVFRQGGTISTAELDLIGKIPELEKPITLRLGPLPTIPPPPPVPVTLDAGPLPALPPMRVSITPDVEGIRITEVPITPGPLPAIPPPPPLRVPLEAGPLPAIAPPAPVRVSLDAAPLPAIAAPPPVRVALEVGPLPAITPPAALRIPVALDVGPMPALPPLAPLRVALAVDALPALPAIPPLVVPLEAGPLPAIASPPPVSIALEPGALPAIAPPPPLRVPLEAAALPEVPPLPPVAVALTPLPLPAIPAPPPVPVQIEWLPPPPIPAPPPVRLEPLRLPIPPPEAVVPLPPLAPRLVAPPPAAVTMAADLAAASTSMDALAKSMTDLVSAASDLTIAEDFAAANTSAAALTQNVRDLSAALRELQVGPGFAAKLSQDLADTLQFLAARSP